jgi:hypothetical protein
MSAMLQEDSPEKWELQELKPWHQQFCSLLAQGIDRETIAKVLDITPNYVSMLSKQPLIQAYIKDMCQFATVQLEAQFAKSVAVIGEVMDKGNGKERLQAVRLNAELTHRIGSGSGLPAEVMNADERFARLAARLLSLQTQPAPPPAVDGEFHEIKTTESTEESSGSIRPPGQSTQTDGNGAENSRAEEG